MEVDYYKNCIPVSNQQQAEIQLDGLQISQSYLPAPSLCIPAVPYRKFSLISLTQLLYFCNIEQV